MTKIVLTAATIALLAVEFPMPVLAQTAEQAAPATVQWLKGPPTRVAFDDWPERALRLDQSGNVVLKCAYNQEGALSGCKVIEQKPKELGFGLAALDMARGFKLKTTLSDGSALTPGEITFAIRFRIDDVG